MYAIRSYYDINRRVRERLLELAGAQTTHVCVPLQGSGTFAVEATIGTLVPRDGKLLILVNGAYGHRIRITSYNVCYTKLLRWIPTELKPAAT